MAVTKTPKDVFRGNPVTAKHEPDPREVVTLLDEMRTETASLVSTVRSIREYDVAANGTDDRAKIQEAIIDAADDGVSLYFPDGVYGIGSSGASIASREYGLLLRSGVRIIGESRSGVIFRALDDIDLINTARGTTHTGVEIRNVTLDGNEGSLGADPTNGFNLWAYGIDGLVIDNVKSLDPASWGIRIERCLNVEMDQIVCDHSAESNSDGIHFVDTSMVTVGTAQVTSLGDDAFIIEATHQSVRDYNIGQLIVDANNQLELDARGFLLLADDSVMDGAWVISNVKANVVAKNCKGGAAVLRGASFLNCDISVISRQCGFGLQIKPGHPEYPGFASNCRFEVNALDYKTCGVNVVTTDGSPTQCHISAQLSSSVTAALGAVIGGARWTGDISLTCSPASSVAGIQWLAQDSRMGVNAIGAARNLVVDAGATNNTFFLGRLSGGSTSDLEVISGANNNTFIGGRVVGAVTVTPASTVFVAVSGDNIP